MKILQVIFSLATGGAERFVVDLTNELSEKADNEVHLIVLNSNDLFYLSELYEKVHYTNLNFSSDYSIMNLLELYSFICKMRPDIVHIHLNLALINLILPVIFCRQNVVYMQTLHNKAENYKGKKLSFYIMKLLYTIKFIRLFTISKDNDESYKRVFQLESDAIIYNGRAKVQKSDKYSIVQEEIKSLKKSTTSTVFLHIARCAPQKNQLLLIESFNKLIADGKDAILLIIGAGFDSPEGKVLKNLASGNVHFLGTRKNVGDYYFQADAFCLSSFYEGMPITLIEAFACKTIPISTPVSGVVDIIQNGVNGYVSDDYTIDSYYKALKEYMVNKNQIDTSKLIQYYNENLSISSCADSYMRNYNKFLTR